MKFAAVFEGGSYLNGQAFDSLCEARSYAAGIFQGVAIYGDPDQVATYALPDESSQMRDEIEEAWVLDSLPGEESNAKKIASEECEQALIEYERERNRRGE